MRIVLAAFLILAAQSATAFDTGYHSDITRAVMHEQGFGETPAKVATVANWLTDYYSTSPTSRDAVQSELSKLHFDNLYTTAEVGQHWARLTANAQEATRRAAESDDPLAMLTVIGLLLHAVQDFYSHSNWVETHPAMDGASYRRETWLADGAPEGTSLFTGSYPPHPSAPPPGHPEHGGYDEGLNKDSQTRPRFAQAYVFAYCASHEVLAAMRTWAEEARPGFWAKLTDYRVDDAVGERLDLDLDAARKLSMWVKGKGAEGHWKGGESGSARYLSGAALDWTSSPSSPFVRQVKKRRIHEWLTRGLYSHDSAPAVPRVEPFQASRTVVEVRTTHVAEKRGGGRRIDRGRKADLYAVTAVGSRRYVDRVLRNKKRYANPWFTIHLAEPDQDEVPIRVEVWDQDVTLGRKDDQCDVNPLPERLGLNLRLRLRDGVLLGDVEGRYDGPENAFETGGAKPDPQGVLLRGYVKAKKLAPR